MSTLPVEPNAYVLTHLHASFIIWILGPEQRLAQKPSPLRQRLLALPLARMGHPHYYVAGGQRGGLCLVCLFSIQWRRLCYKDNTEVCLLPFCLNFSFRLTYVGRGSHSFAIYLSPVSVLLHLPVCLFHFLCTESYLLLRL